MATGRGGVRNYGCWKRSTIVYPPLDAPHEVEEASPTQPLLSKNGRYPCSRFASELWISPSSHPFLLHTYRVHDTLSVLYGYGSLLVSLLLREGFLLSHSRAGRRTNTPSARPRQEICVGARNAATSAEIKEGPPSYRVLRAREVTAVEESFDVGRLQMGLQPDNGGFCASVPCTPVPRGERAGMPCSCGRS